MLTDQQQRQRGILWQNATRRDYVRGASLYRKPYLVSKLGAIIGGILWACLFWLALILTP